MNRRSFVGGFGGIVLGAIAGCLSAPWSVSATEKTEQRTYTASKKSAIRVRNENGPVTVKTFDSDEIEVDLVYRGPSTGSVDAVSVTEERHNGTLTLATEYEDVAGDVSVAITVRCPRETSIDSVQTSNASIEIDIPRIDGDTEIVTANGTIVAELAPTLNADITATTTNGSIDVEGFDFTPNTEAGRRLNGSLGDGSNTLLLETANASITIQRLSR